MTTVTYTVPAIHCGHCTHTIEMEVGELQGVQSVKAEEATKKVTITLTTPLQKRRSRHCLLRSITLLKVCLLCNFFKHEGHKDHEGERIKNIISSPSFVSFVPFVFERF